MSLDHPYQTIELHIRDVFAYIILNRPEVKNAMNTKMIAELTHAFRQLRGSRNVRAIVLSGAEGNFCAGSDVKEMQAAYAHPDKDRERTADFDTLLEVVNKSPQVVVARVEGEALGGGLGLLCVTDIAFASVDAVFAFPEVRIGIAPALILPYVIHRVGLTTARRLLLTGARFDATEAVKYGFVHDAYDPVVLDEQVNEALADVRECSPSAIAVTKKLMHEVYDPHIETNADYRAGLLDKVRKSRDGQEGMLAYIQKRKPGWARPTSDAASEHESQLDKHDTRNF